MFYMAVFLDVSRRLHTTNDGLHEASGHEGSVRLPLFLPRSVFVVRDTSYANKTVFTVAQYRLNDCVKFAIKSECPHFRNELLSELVVSHYLSSRGDWSQMYSWTIVLSKRIIKTNYYRTFCKNIQLV